MRKLLAAALIFSLVSVVGCGKEKAQGPQKVAESSSNEAVGLKAHDFSFKSVDGKNIKLSDFKGKVVILQFFGTFCDPCKAEMPFLEELYKKYNGKIEVIGLCVDYIGKSPSELKSFVKEMKISYPVVIPDENTWYQYAYITETDAIPQTFIIDKEGYIRYFNVGYTPQYNYLFEKAVEELLSEK